MPSDTQGKSRVREFRQHGSVRGALRRITRKPFTFAPHEWFGRETVSDEIVALLPPRSLTLTAADTRFIDQAFAHGAVPGIRWMRPDNEV